MSIRLTPLTLTGLVVGTAVSFSWSAVAIPPTLDQIAAGRKSHLEIFNASNHTLMTNVVDTGQSFTVYPQAVHRIAVPEPARSLTFTPDYVTNTSGLNAVVVTYYAPYESQEEWIHLATPTGNGAATTMNQTLIKNVTWNPGDASPIVLSSFFPVVLTHVPYLAELIIFHDQPSLTKRYSIIGKSYAITLSDSLSTVKTIAADYEHPGTLSILFPVPYSFGISGAAILCGIVADSGGNFTYSGGITMIGYEL